MEFKKATHTNIKCILDIIFQAQNHLKSKGIDQWQNNYPNITTIENDINNNSSYILLKDEMVVGTVAVLFDGEKTYNSIYNGQWMSKGKYGTIHRIAIDPQYHGQGLGTVMIKKVEEMCIRKGIKSMRVDTHRDNLGMQRLLLKNGFEYCGIIYLADGSERLAFERVIAK